MPTYAYRCANCGHEMEVSQKIVDAPLSKCPQCGKETLKRGPGGGIGVLFAGQGWYKDGYGAGGSKEPPAPSSGGGCCPCGKNPKGGCSS